MSLPFSVPDWLPWWVPTLILVPLLLYALVFLLMPFSVIGLKGRVETLDARLDAIQGEIRSLTLRLPEPVRGGYEETYVGPSVGGGNRPVLSDRPPIPPAPVGAGDALALDMRPPRHGRAPRAEPRLDWPRPS